MQLSITQTAWIYVFISLALVLSSWKKRSEAYEQARIAFKRIRTR